MISAYVEYGAFSCYGPAWQNKKFSLEHTGEEFNFFFEELVSNPSAMKKDNRKIRTAILIMSFALFAFLLTRSRWNAPILDRDLCSTVTVEVKGDVSEPGIYSLDRATATVAAAAAMAGCPWKIPGDTGSRKLMPGQSLEVLRGKPDATIRFGRMPGGALLACGLKLGLNSATLEELLLIPHMRHEIAGSIIERRKEKPWEGVDELTEISGVGPKTVQNFKDYLDADDTKQHGCN